MSNNTTDQPEFANYAGQPVMVLQVDSNQYGNLALIQFEDGREDWVPLTRVEFLD